MPLLAFPLLFTSCNQEEGEGGRSEIQGYIYRINVNDNLTRDTFPANDQRVQIIYGDLNGYDDTKTTVDGFFHFKYLREGDYSIVTYDELPNDQLVPVSKQIHINGKNKTYSVDTIYIESGKALNTHFVTGKIGVKYIDKNISAFLGDTLPAVDFRVFLEKESDITFLEDVRTHEDGTFVFSRLTPGKYRVWVAYEEHYTEVVSSVGKDFEIDEKGRIFLIKEGGEKEQVEDLGIIVTRINT